MSGPAHRWAATERIRQAEHEAYGDGEVQYDPTAQRHRNVKAIRDPNYNITDKTLPPDRPKVRILHVLEQTLSSEHDDDAISNRARELADIVTSAPMRLWHATYTEIVAMIISAAKGVDGEAASEALARLVAALARRGELVNSGEEDLSYEIGDFWVRKVKIRPGEVLTGEGGLRIWSEMPSFRLWVKEEIDRFPASDPRVNIAEAWPGRSWENMLRFCENLSSLHLQGRSSVSSLWAAHGLQVMVSVLENSDPSQVSERWKLAAVYVDAFGEEIYSLCREGVQFDQHGRGTSASSGEEGFSLKRWTLWKDWFREHATSSSDRNPWATSVRVVEQMQYIESK